jgi:hypothetical protein
MFAITCANVIVCKHCTIANVANNLATLGLTFNSRNLVSSRRTNSLATANFAFDSKRFFTDDVGNRRETITCANIRDCEGSTVTYIANDLSSLLFTFITSNLVSNNWSRRVHSDLAANFTFNGK